MRFQQNVILNGKTKYEETSTIIKSLEEELVSLKHKFSFVHEKDQEIGKLKETVNTFKKTNEELQETVDRLQNNMNDLNSSVNKLQIKNKTLSDELDLSNIHAPAPDVIEDLIDNTLDIDEIEDVGEEMISIDIPQLKYVLLNRLKNKQKDHIDQLIHEYELRKHPMIKKSIMEQMLEKAIHL
jgi:chromosome segregation ATPase